MSLLDRHLEFVAALRAAGMPVSVSESLDAVGAIQHMPWDDREMLRAAYAATLVKRQVHRTNFDDIFDLFFPTMIGAGSAWEGDEGVPGIVDPETRDEFRDRLAGALAEGDGGELQALAIEAVQRFGMMPNRAPGLARWSAYEALRQVAPSQLIEQILFALLDGDSDRETRQTRAEIEGNIDGFRHAVESDARRRVAEDKSPEEVAANNLRPPIDQLAFTAARKAELDQMRREIYPLARRLATRLTQERHGRRRGQLDFRKTIRESLSSGGVPIDIHLKPKRPHRTELVVLCDVSGSCANFAQFTLLLVYALREQFTKVRAFTFVDGIHEVTPYFRPGAHVADTMTELAESVRYATLWGRTNYGRALTKFNEQHSDALGPKTSLLILGDARSNYSDLALPLLKDMVGQVRHAHFLNPEPARQWSTGDSGAAQYAEIINMVECRNLQQLGDFVHDLV
jgi:hypothetical protein